MSNATDKHNEKNIAFITGANRGIGFETARQLGRLGVFPVIGARTEENGQAAVASLAADGIAADYLIFDVTSAADRQAAFAWFDREFGRLDILVNNAGMHLEGEPGVQQLYTIATLPEKVLRDTLEANFFAPVALTQTLLPLLAKSNAGRIVNLSSILASLTLHADAGSPIYEMKSFAYDTSKTALNSFTIQLAHGLRGTNIKVNSAHPGWVQTAMGGSAAPMPVEEGAQTSVRLATLPADGPNGGFFHQADNLPW